MLANKTNCILAHAFNATAIKINKFDNTIITCGGDRLCKQWRVQKPDDKIILVRPYMLNKISVINQIIVSNKRIIAAGPEGFESFSFSPANQRGLFITGSPTVCGWVS